VKIIDAVGTHPAILLIPKTPFGKSERLRAWEVSERRTDEIFMDVEKDPTEHEGTEA
jgi:hypothetical protein